MILSPSRLNSLQLRGLARSHAAGAGFGGGEHAVDDGLTPGQRRKVSVELAEKRGALAEHNAEGRHDARL